jgi:formyl-CoA transferase
MVDPASGRAEPVNAGRAATLQPNAVFFYQPLPHGRVSGAGALARVALRRWQGDVFRFATAGLLAGLVTLAPAVLVGVFVDEVAPAERVGTLAWLTAGMLLAQGILLALFERERSGEGQWVHTSLLEAQIQMLDFQAARWLISQEVAPQAGNDHPTSIPTGVFPTADGHINIAASGGVLWQRLCQTLGLEALLDDPDYADNELRSKNRKALNARIAEVTPSRTSEEWIEVLNEAGVPCGPINTIDATFADPQVQALGIARPMPRQQLGDTHVVGQAINLARTPQPPSHRPTPELGEHTDEILSSLGMDGEAIRGLRENGVI